MGERLRVGDTFAGKYLLKSLLGEGGMGQVWRAIHVGHEREVALKTMLPDVRPADLEHLREHFLMESQVVLRLQHKNIVPVFDRGEHEGVLYFTMQYVAGGMDVEHVLRRSSGNRLPWHLAAHVIGQVLEALAEAHRLKIVHRDLKPANVMVDPRGYMLLMDFGVAKQLTATVSMKTHTKGTYGFMPPDGFVGFGYSVASDVFSVGAMLRRMVVGTNFLTDGVTMDEEIVGRLLRLEHESIPTMAASGFDVPPELDAFVTRCMAFSPRDRYRDAAEAHEALFPLTPRRGEREMVHHISSFPTMPGPSAGTPIGNVEGVPERIPTRGPGETPIRAQTPVMHLGPPQPPVAMTPPSPPPTGSVHGQVAAPSKLSPKKRARRGRLLIPVMGAMVGLGMLVAYLATSASGGQATNQAAASPSRVDAAVMRAATPPDAAVAVIVPPVTDASQPDAMPTVPSLMAMRLNVSPNDATVFVEGARLAGAPPYELTKWAAGTQLRVRLEREGYQTLDQTIAVEPTVSLSLEPLIPSKPVPVPSVPRERPERRGGEGDLVIRTRGGTAVVVYLDGSRKGVAPLRLNGIAAGRHTLTFVNDETQERKRVRVEVKAGSEKAVETGW
jgi:serine/threonine protein kinase